MNRTRITRALAVMAASLVAMPAIAHAADYHHVHITASNATEAVRWYTRHMECQALADRDDGVDCGGAQVVFDARPTLGSSQRTGIDHISFSYADLTAKMADLEGVGVQGSGVRMQRFEDGSTLRDAPGLFKYGFVFDPWGTRIELVEDPDTLGFHHIHLSSTDPATTLAWYQETFGGESARLLDRLDGIMLGDIWLLAMRHEEGTPAATAGRGIDHIAFSVENMDAATAQMRRAGVEFLEEPAVPQGGRSSARRAMIAGPDNVSLAVVESGFAGVVADVSTVTDITTNIQPYTVPRTPWGTPDLQAVWTGDAAHGISFERPRDLGDADVLTPEQAAARRERGTLGSIWGYEAEWRDTTLGYVKSAPSRQVAMVIDPPDGRIPPRTAEAQERAANARGRFRRGALPEGPENLSNWVRCITRGLVPMPAIYNNGLQISQGPGFVTVQREMVHETRVIPTDGSPHVGSNITSYMGDPRGHWEGDTLVVEITNFNGRAPFRGSSENLTLTERYTRTGLDTLRYEFTLDDPTVWTRPWTGMYTFVRDETQYELVEYACHEGNYGMTNILSGSRAKEREAEAGR
jgi:catechol 2,3-dioxygenase-like lactoylglutathione lyase family enzyme